MGEPSNDDYDGQERRAHHKTLQDVETAFNRQLQDHERREFERIDKVIGKAIEDLKKEAFADGPVPHRLAHEAMMKAAAAEEEFWRGMKMKIAEKGILGLLQVLFMLTVLGLGASIAAKFGLMPAFTAWLMK